MMRISNVFAVFLALSGGAVSQRPSNTSICDYYTTALLKNNTADNQYTLLTLVVNTVVIGNYTQPNVGISVPGILAKGMYNGTEVNLLPYFDGSLASSNRGNSSGVSVNFLDDGGAAPLMMNKPSNGTTSNQYMLLTHLYQFFGALLGCSQYGNSGFPAYAGHASMASVHRFMDLDAAEVGYFIQQVGLAAASFGVASSDVTAVGEALEKLFGYRCSPATTVIPAQGPQLQAVCLAETCPIAPANATCAAYPSSPMPMNASSTTSGNMSSSMTGMTGMPTATASGNDASNAGSRGMALMMGVSGMVVAAAALL